MQEKEKYLEIRVKLKKKIILTKFQNKKIYSKHFRNILKMFIFKE